MVNNNGYGGAPAPPIFLKNFKKKLDILLIVCYNISIERRWTKVWESIEKTAKILSLILSGVWCLIQIIDRLNEK